MTVAGRHVDLPGRGSAYVREARGPEGAPTLVLLHGLGATAALNWDACVPTLATRFDVLAPDHRGHGRGIRCGAGFRLEDCADDVAALIRQECRGPVLVAGYSMGGPIAQLLCRDHPELVAGMALCATARDFRGSPAERIRFGLLAPIALASRLTPPVPNLLPEALRPHRLFGERAMELGRHERRAMVAAANCIGSFTSRDWVCDLAAPAAVVVTLRDGLVPPRRQRRLAECLAAPVVELDGHHFVPHSDPQALAGAILAAIDLLPDPAGRRRPVAA